MDREAIKTYSYRISQATRSELVVIVYDIIRDYLKDAVSTSDNAVFKEKLHMAMRGIDQLITGLDMQYELSGNLYVLYNYMKRTSIYDMLGQLRQSFYEVSRQDNSAPLMKNTEKVYSGLTYSKYGAGNETASDTLINRGYMV